MFSGMIISGANNLYNNRRKVDALNVFPVPDGDTGTNMSLTIGAVANELISKAPISLTKSADIMSFAALRGARGNSGVILSQFFRGIARSVKGSSECNARDFAIALTEGSTAAYKAVMKPTEGTILTVARAAATAAGLAANDSDDISVVLKKMIDRGNEALAKTPEQLPALKEAGVVDAGGQGWMLILEGALVYLETGKGVEKEASDGEIPAKPVMNTVAVPAQNKIKTEDIKFRYCTEFIIEKADPDTDAEEFRSKLAPKGDCMLVIDDEKIIKVHIHTNDPGFVLTEAAKLGEMINLKIDNMRFQHSSIINDAPKPIPDVKVEVKPEKKAKEKKTELKEYGFVAVCAGKNFAKMLRDMGVDKTIEGGQTMNPSTDDILKAVKHVTAKTVFVFPDNKNIIMAANQAATLTEDKKVIVIPTKDIPQCISAMMAFNDRKNADENTEAMNRARHNVKTGQVTYSVRDTEIDGVQIKKNDILGIAGGKITTVGSNIDDVLTLMTEKMIDGDSEYVTVYCGKDVKKAHEPEVQEIMEKKFAESDIEISFKRGGQPVYYYVVSVE